MLINGKILYSMAISAANSLENNKNEINNLNVFPVPDGDTGINMSLTMGGARSVVQYSTISECADQIANRVLRSARGNSGAILSLFFRGVAKAVRGLESADSFEIAAAFASGKAEAYKAVMNPTEGTILTVIRTCAECAEKEKDRYVGNVEGLFDVLLETAKETLSKTPEMLPILKQAKVVDAGGAGFVKVLEGMTLALHGVPVESKVAETGIGGVGSSANFGEFHTEDIKFGYCTECIVEKSLAYRGEGRAADFYRFIMGIGDSAVFLDDDEIIKLHVHTNHPGKVLETALKYGSLATVKIENMRMQHSELSGGAVTSEASSANHQHVVAVPEKDFGFVSVCLGDGICEVFRDLGVDQIVSGGQTMNPSTEDLLQAILATPAKTVFVYPNNKNIYMVADQASKLVNDRRVIVVETKSVPQGISALMAFDPEMGAEENAEQMRSAIEGVTVLSSTYAVRDTEIDGIRIRKDDVIGMCNGKIKVSLAKLLDSVRALIEDTASILENASFISVFWGEGTSEEEATRVTEMLQEKASNAEVSLICGGQPVYSYIISIE